MQGNNGDWGRIQTKESEGVRTKAKKNEHSITRGRVFL